MKTRPCKYCGASIFWARNVKTGKLIPLNAGSGSSATVRFELVDDYNRRDDVELRCESRSVRGYQSHFETCPNAEEARRPRT